MLLSCSAAQDSAPLGASCSEDADCGSGNCEPSSFDAVLVCCGVACIPGTVCSTSGDRCVTCDREVETCNTKLEAGARCEEDAECSTNRCIADETLVARCCDDECAEGCNANGRCLGLQSTATAGLTTTQSTTSNTTATALPPKDSQGPVTGLDEEELPDSTSPSGVKPTTSAPATTTPRASDQDGTSLPDDAKTPPASTSAPSATGTSASDGDTPIKECADGATRPCSVAGAKGNCAKGQQPCQQGHWGTCSVQPLTADSCTTPGDDANCNGVANEGCECESGDPEECEAEPESPVDSAPPVDSGPPSDAAACMVGATQACSEHPGFDGKGRCRAGTRVCTAGANGAGAAFGACTGAVGPAATDSCEEAGDDSNCNGALNDGCPTMTPPPATVLQGTVLWSFDSSAQGWQLRLTDPESLESTAQVVFSSSLGDPSAGSLMVKMPFTGHNQKIEFNVHPDEALNLTGKQFRARVVLVSGLTTDTNSPGGIKLFAKAGEDYVYVSGRWRYLTNPGQWEEVFLDPGAPDFSTGDFDLEDVREVGFEIRTFQDTTEISPAVVHIDSITY